VDFSDFSRHAVDHAVAIARWYGASVTALHVLPPPVSLVPMGDIGVYPPYVLTPEDLERVRDALQRFLDEECGAAAVSGEIVEGQVMREISRRAETLPADLVVLGTHGRSGFERLMLGSVAERALRTLTCPVLTVPRRAPDAVASGPALFSRILCAIDASPASTRALAYAASLAAQAGASLTAIHVVELLPAFEPAALRGPGTPSLDDELRARARAQLHEVVTATVGPEAHVTEVITEGKPHQEILRHAHESRMDLIVLGAHGGGLGLAAFGSTASHVVRAAECPVLTLKA
jgi:nucleotide-binding universal stress UspA family protein